MTISTYRLDRMIERVSLRIWKIRHHDEIVAELEEKIAELEAQIEELNKNTQKHNKNTQKHNKNM